MSIQDQPLPKTTVVEIAGKVTIGYDAKMRDTILEATDAGAQNVLLKMDRVTKIEVEKAANVRRYNRDQAKEAQKQDDDRAYAQQTLEDLAEYRNEPKD